MKWIFVKISKVYHFLGSIISFCFVFILISIISAPITVHCVGGLQLAPTPWYRYLDLNHLKGYIITGVFLIAFVMSLLYFILGIARYFVANSVSNKGNSVKILLLRGITGILGTIILFVALDFELSFFFTCF